jgi:menaquinone-dependent protoporphyrinogen oxidase
MGPRILVLYATTDGQTGRIAGAIGRTLREVGAEVEVVNAATRRARAIGPQRFDGIIVAASVHAGGYQRSILRWTRSHLAELNRRPHAFVSVCLGVLQHDPAVDRELTAIAERFFQKSGWRPRQVKVVAGALLYTQYSWWKRRIMRRIVAKAQGDTDTSRDYEYTDWAELAAFSRAFADQVRPLSSNAPDAVGQQAPALVGR